MVQTRIEHFPICEHFDYCKNIMLKMMLDKPNRKCYWEVADAKGLPCYENDQSGCSKFNYLEANGERLQVRLPPSMIKRMESREIKQPVETEYEQDPMVA